MTGDKPTPPQAFIKNIAEVFWEQPPAHYDAFSKMLVRPEVCGSKHLDYRISSYEPKGYVARHSHRKQEQIYHVLEGEGLVELGNERRVVRKHDVVFIPPGVEHAFYNTGLGNLVFLVITSPPDDH